MFVPGLVAVSFFKTVEGSVTGGSATHPNTSADTSERSVLNFN